MSSPARASFPPVVYVPTEGGGPVEERRVEMRRTPDERVALFCYSAIDRLHAMYREGAPWLLLTVAQLQTVHDYTPYDLLYLDCTVEDLADPERQQEVVA